MTLKIIKIFRLFGKLLAIIFFVLALTTAYLQNQWNKETEVTTGTVVELDSDIGSVHYQPTIEFFDNNGKKIVFREATGTNPKEAAVQIGQTVSVRYHVVNSTDARLDGIAYIWHVPITFCIFGIFIGLISMVRLVKKKGNYSIVLWGVRRSGNR